ncbi:hypothetical protein U1Q18_012972 [Sarracenia purpurea var. burkii]
MGSWRRQKSDNYSQEVTRTGSQHRKPPLGNWQPTVPSWEKKFCTVIGAVPWRKVLENKKFIHLYDNVLKWNDSAGEEAFINAKNRFWAEINGLPCAIPLPDPDVYIDKIDWNSKVDPELLLDLECESLVPSDQEKREQVVILGEPLISTHLYSSTGWGDAEDDVKKNGSSLGNKGNPWEEHNYAQSNGTDRHNGWENDCSNDLWCRNQGTGAVEDGGWEDGWNNRSWGLSQWENNNYETDHLKDGRTAGNSWGEQNYAQTGWGNNFNGDGWNKSWGLNQWETNNYEGEYLKDGRTAANSWGEQNYAQNGWENDCNNNSWCRNWSTGAAKDGGWENGWNNSWSLNKWENNNSKSDNLKDGRWDANNRNQEKTGQYMSRYRTWKFHGNESVNNRERRNGKGRKKGNSVLQRPSMDNMISSRQWNLTNSCAPVDHHGSANPGNRWNWDKQVS